MTNLEEYKRLIQELARIKGYNTDNAWLQLGIFKESGELWQAFEHKQSDEDLGKEFAGMMHYILQLMGKIAPNLDLDKALMQEIQNNYQHKKKTYENGEIVKK